MNLYWVGIRESEILNTGNLFKGNICIYGKNSLMTNTRINHNEDKNWEMIDNYFSETKEKLIKEKPDIKFMHYNYSGMIGKDLKNCICYNNSYLIDDLNNKFYTKSYFKNVVPVLDYEIIKGKDILFNLKIKKRFGTEIVIQEKEGTGGENTSIINIEGDFLLDLKKEYLVSTYCKNNIPVNIHLIIGNNKITLLPPSVQIIKNINNNLIYMGCDFIAYRSIENKIIKKHEEYAFKIGKELQKIGYKGICGIDSIIYNDEVFFMEINPRFQSSSTILNKALYENKYPSLQYMQLKSFEGDNFEDINIDVNYSSIMNLAGIKNTIDVKPFEIYDLDNRELIEESQSYQSTFVYDKSIYKQKK